MGFLRGNWGFDCLEKQTQGGSKDLGLSKIEKKRKTLNNKKYETLFQDSTTWISKLIKSSIQSKNILINMWN